MKPVTNIRLLWRKEINEQRWNECIGNAPNGLVYAQSAYLDALCDNWCAIVQDDYTAVLPLPWRSKWGINYVYTPFFIPVLSFFGKDEMLGNAAALFEKAAENFRYIRMDVDLPQLHDPLRQLEQEPRTNQIIKPGQASLSRLACRKLNIAKEHGLVIVTNTAPEGVIEAYQKHYSYQHKEVNADAYQRLIKACKSLLAANLLTLTAHLPDEPFAAFYLLLRDTKCMYSLLGGSTENGKKAGAFYALTNQAVQLAAASDQKFRFEGSDVPGIHFFNKQFGAVDAPYIQLVHNNLPPLLKWLKR